MITLLWAQTRSGVIGKAGHLPWDIKAEMQHFINYTRHKTVLMGRNTWESLKLKPLPNRKNIVVTSRPMTITHPNLEVTNNLKNVLKYYENSGEELIIIGGSKVYETVLAMADKLVISYIYQDYDGDTYAPSIESLPFKLIETKKYQDFEVAIYERKI
ncbi:dihydrofolate reductase [Spiroplasma clarkii]|uniref:dihydrofolate reductase n=1 Tax=Spiroplasma clarkii TaxID=2139 RepID=A0A1Y0L0X6_9MOLU|nr:dihydrofolate reductase [Spiroplasma clarkii]ARU91430.1 dihydrofolate reductase [Spiroplasma clarkii]ATX70846.1 dihydrofolate reductase [Spiroplasma clarkii]